MHDVRLAALLLALSACGSPAGGGDAGVDTPGVDDDACQGACSQTSVTAMFQVTRMLDRAYFGNTFDTNNLRIEAYAGAGAGCPTMSSPTPDYTLIVAEVSPDKPPNMATANILDFEGDLLGGPLGLAATQVRVMRTSYQADTLVVLDVMLTFSTGTVMGHIYATYCDSLDN
ncbi:MAG TPA: hypothetical protein VIV11_18845 [Kofleriaceae bacterium]